MPVERIVIVGGGTAAWLAAAALARRTAASILVIELPGIDDSLGLPLPVESTLPATGELLADFGFDEDALLRDSRGCFALGRALSDWGGASAAFHPYGDIGAPIGAVAFHQLAQRLRHAGEQVRLTNYALAALAAQAGRFVRPSASAASVLSTMGYGLQFETARLRQALRADAMAHKATTQPGSIAEIVFDSHGLIVALQLETGEQVSGDLFLDCSGPGAAVNGRLPDAQFLDWSSWLACDAALFSLSADEAPPLSYGHIAAHAAGWRMTAAVQGGVGEAIACVSGAVERFDTAPYRFVQGRQSAPWLGNCLSIGGAAAMLEPLASTQLHLAASAVARLIALFPADRTCRAEAAEYNRQAGEELDNARDFVIAHYKLNARTGEPLWDRWRAMEGPPRLAQRIALYEGIGRIALYDEENFEASDWIALFDAMGIEPRRHDVMADAIPQGQVSGHLARIREVMLQALAQMPSHADYLRTHCHAHAEIPR